MSWKDESQPLARDAMAYVLAGGRGSRAEGTDRPARQARGLFRRQDPHHRLRAVERAEFRHPPHRRRHAVQGAQPDPPPAARLELLPPRAQRELRHPARLASASPRTSGTRAPPTRSTRTSTSSRATTPKYMVILAGDHIYKMDYELMLQQHVDQRRRRHRRLPRGAAHGGHRLRRHACRRERTRSSPSSKSPPIRPACPASPTWRWPRWASTSSTPSSCSTCCAATPPIPNSSPRLRQGPHPLHRQERQGRRAPLRRTPASAPSTEAEAYWRDVGTVDAYWQANIDLTDIVPELDLYDQRLADLDLSPRSRRRPSSSMTRRAAAAARSPRWSRATASSPAPRSAARCSSPACRVNSYRRARRRGGAARRRRSAARARLQQRRHRPRRRASRRAWSSARIRSSTPSASAAPRAASA